MRHTEINIAGDMPEGGAMPRAMGCLFCRTGKEYSVAKRIEQACPWVRAIVPCREKHKSHNGQKTKVREVFLPGYVFFEAPDEEGVLTSLPREDVIRILQAEPGLWQLVGDDLRFAQWLLRYEGLMGFSKAYQEGERIRIISGPLKDLEGCIKRIDRRGRSGQISVDFNGRNIRVWLGFDLIDPIEKPTNEVFA